MLLLLLPLPLDFMQGTFSPGGAGAICQSCPGEGAGYTTVPYIAATSASSCVCIPGYGMSDKGLCRICPANTYSEGISKEDCKPCPFGHTSAPGSCGKNECVPASQPCPVGQIAPPGAVSSDQCVCLPGHGGKHVGFECSLLAPVQQAYDCRHTRR